MKVYVDYGQKWMAKRQLIMNPDKKTIPFNSGMHVLNFMDKNSKSIPLSPTMKRCFDGITLMACSRFANLRVFAKEANV